MTLSFRYLALMILLNSLLTGCGYNAPNPTIYSSMKYAAGNNKKPPKGHVKPEEPKKTTEPISKPIKKSIIKQPPNKGQGVKPTIGQSSKIPVVESTPSPPKAEPPAEIPASIDP